MAQEKIIKQLDHDLGSLKEDAERVMAVLEKRFAKYGLTLHPEKTRLIEFGPKALEKSERPGGKPPATFVSLFTHSEGHIRGVHMGLRSKLGLLPTIRAWMQ
ncbi:MAG TPA: hypothetical protein V6D17_17875 [Candidatus Obscuribacterales bacterium]